MTLLLICTHLIAMVLGGKIALRHLAAQLRYRQFRRNLHNAVSMMRVMAVGGLVFVGVIVVGLASAGAF